MSAQSGISKCRMMGQFLVLIGLGIFLGSILGRNIAQAQKPGPGLPALMHYYYGTLEQLKPYMLSMDEFRDPKNKEALRGLLRDFETKITENQPKEIKDSPGFNMTYPLMSRHLRDVVHLYDHGIYELAWHKLNATSGFCMACHTRLPRKVEEKAFNWAKRGANIVDPKDLRDAEFYYISHNYNMALEIFDKAIATHTNEQEVGELKKIYERKIPYFARVKRDPVAAIASLKKDAKNTKLPAQIKEDLKTWIAGFEKWRSDKTELGKLSNEELLVHVRKIVSEQTTGRAISINDPFIVNLLRISGVLYERLYQKKESAQTPEILFALAKLERDLASIRYFSLADVYLKECVMQYPKSPVAKECFQEYSVAMKQKFGTVVPEYITNSIETLGKMIQ